MLRVLQQELTWSEISISRHPKLSLQCPCTIDSNIVLLHPYSFKKQEIAVKIKKHSESLAVSVQANEFLYQKILLSKNPPPLKELNCHPNTSAVKKILRLWPNYSLQEKGEPVSRSHVVD